MWDIGDSAHVRTKFSAIDSWVALVASVGFATLGWGCDAVLTDGSTFPAGAAQTSDGTDVAQNPQTTATTPSVEPRGVQFQIGKWLNEAGTERAMVSGAFDFVEVAFSAPVPSLDGDLTGLEATVSVDVRSLNTGSEIRDENIRVSYFETEDHPFAKVVFKNFRLVGPSVTFSGGHNILGDATLELHGSSQVTNNVSLEVLETDADYRVRTTSPIVVRVDVDMPVPALLTLCEHVGIDSYASVTVDVVVPKAEAAPEE
jgi:polyisoprenoid-binding protein YceI